MCSVPPTRLTFSTKGGYNVMLTENDINFMAESQDEIYTLRQRPINVIYLDEVIDEYTGEVISENEEPREAGAVEIGRATSRESGKHAVGGSTDKRKRERN